MQKEARDTGLQQRMAQKQSVINLIKSPFLPLCQLTIARPRMKSLILTFLTSNSLLKICTIKSQVRSGQVRPLHDETLTEVSGQSVSRSSAQDDPSGSTDYSGE